MDAGSPGAGLPRVPGGEPGLHALLGISVLVVGALAFAAVAATRYDAPLFRYRYLGLMAATLVVVAGWELLAVRVHRRNFDFRRARAWTETSTRRVHLHCAALAGHLVLATAAYVVLTHYGLNLGGGRLLRFEASWYAPWFSVYFALAGAVVVLGPAYAWACERWGRWSQEEDDLLGAARGYGAVLRLPRPDTTFWRRSGPSS